MRKSCDVDGTSNGNWALVFDYGVVFSSVTAQDPWVYYLEISQT
jgi:lipoprotein signal peptidase